jgi:ABC-2 type transport system ATP-binding protein
MSSDVNLGALSMGQKKKVYMCIALAANTPYLFMDEPTNGLDIPSKGVFRRLLAEWATPERTAIISTHQVKDVENLLDHIVIIDNRGLIVDASTYDICQKLHFTIENSANGALYSTPSLGGYATVRPNTTDAESNIDLELLFGVATSQREEIKSILNPSTK